MEQALTEVSQIPRLLHLPDCTVRRTLKETARPVAAVIDVIEQIKCLARLLNGGISYHGDLEEQVSIDRAHFERLAARLPAILPRFVWTELLRLSLLFLGHGLEEPDVRTEMQKK